jgi:hypothetical protein
MTSASAQGTRTGATETGDIRTSPLSESEIRAFLRDGFLFPGKILTDEQLSMLRDATERLDLSTHVGRNFLYDRDPAFRALTFDSRFALWGGQLLGTTRLVAAGNSLLIKPPRTVAELQWHQDWSNWPLDPSEGLTFWVTLDDATMEKGSMQFAVGTHTLGRFLGPILASGLDEDTVRLLKTKYGLRDLPSPDALELALQDVEIKAGECSIHHGLLWHRSGSNGTTEPRRAIVERYADGNCIFSGFTPSALLPSLSYIDPGGSPHDIGRPIADLDVYPVIHVVEPRSPAATPLMSRGKRADPTPGRG